MVHDVGSLRDQLSAARQIRDRNLLVRMNGSFVGQVFVLEEDAFTIGRAPESDVWVHEAGVSRRHARVELDDEGWWLVDCGSANGTFVDGKRVDRYPLSDGDVFQIGPSALFRFTQTDREHERMLLSLYEASVTDSLTGAFNREHFEERLRAEISFAKRHRTEVGLIIFDLDRFKLINDTHGHPVGDQVLIEVVAVVRASVRLEDMLARYGGEEFVLVLRNIDLEGTAQLAERLRARFAQTCLRVASGEVRPTASFGCAALSECSELEVEALVDRADQRLLVAKRTGRNRVVAHDS